MWAVECGGLELSRCSRHRIRRPGLVAEHVCDHMFSIYQVVAPCKRILSHSKKIYCEGLGELGGERNGGKPLPNAAP